MRSDYKFRASCVQISFVELSSTGTVMGEKTPLVCRVLLVLCLLTFAVLIASSFCWLWRLHVTVEELRETLGKTETTSSRSRRQIDDDNDYHPVRTARHDGLGDTVESYLKKISQLQVKRSIALMPHPSGSYTGVGFCLSVTIVEGELFV